jgi:hypothetical protein
MLRFILLLLALNLIIGATYFLVLKRIIQKTRIAKENQIYWLILIALILTTVTIRLIV